MACDLLFWLLTLSRADALARLGRPGGAAAALRRAIDLAPTAPGRRLLSGRLAAVQFP